MKAQIIELNPKEATRLLKKNKGNRRVKAKTVDFYAEQMRRGEWRENGEAIIVDVNGNIKDGQHRLLATIKANHTWKVPLVTGVLTSVMSTIDTGANRTLGDILELNSFKYSNQMAALIRRIMKWKRDQDPLRNQGDVGEVKLSNQQGLEYARQNAKMLEDILVEVNPIYSHGDKCFTKTDLAFFYWLISEEGTNRTERHRSFIKMLVGVKTVEKNAASYVHRTKLAAKMGKQRIAGRWLLGITIKAWNSFVMGDPAVKYLKFDINTPLPKLNVL